MWRWISLQLFVCFLTCRAQEDSGGATDIPWFIWFVAAVGFVIGTILVVVSLVCIIRCWRRAFHQPPTSHGTREDTTGLVGKKQETVDMAIPLRDTDRLMSPDVNWELRRDKVKVLQRLGIGEFGPIFDAEVQLEVNLTSRALIKVFHQGTSQDLAHFRADIDAIMHLSHPRVARLFGVVSQPPYWVVLELTVNGDLKSFLMNTLALQADVRPVLNTPHLVAMAADVASGLSYLESIQYVHKDVAARNCIVTQSLSVKITDFRIGRYLFRSEYAVQADGSLMPLRWMAPEALLENIFNLSTDVWSFGILLWEVMSRGSFPYPELGDPEVVSTVCQGQRLLQPVGCPNSIYRMMLRCWSSNPRKRPQMATVHKQLEASILANRYAPPRPR